MVYARGKVVSQVERSNWYTLIHRDLRRDLVVSIHTPRRTIRSSLLIPQSVCYRLINTVADTKNDASPRAWRESLNQFSLFLPSSIKFIDANRAHLSRSLRNESFRSINIEKSFALLSRSKCSLNNSRHDVRQIAIRDIIVSCIATCISLVYISLCHWYMYRMCASCCKHYIIHYLKWTVSEM